MRWHESTWTRIGRMDRGTPVVIPLGSIEQHGPHLPLAVDTIQVEAIADRLEHRLGDRALFLPTQWLGSSHHHMDFTGTISLRPSLYGQLVQELARCVLAHGFTRVLFLNGHGGNEAPATAALSELVATDDRADRACIAFSSWWKAGRDALAPERHGMTTPSISHACEYETSLLMALRPE
ncbi:MAG: creatininase family protein, partial [Planctomycetes bacterium]|nr:creatininase family protein [Planctomycetota bacterium]